ncbi:AMP-binding protein [Paenibacillus sp. KS-LC4]|uniref:AMP-binding protein n=1 Tax=Paenibacillus sp. KS-LC4 TaxID=2979727 RepID=UPI0030CC4403
MLLSSVNKQAFYQALISNTAGPSRLAMKFSSSVTYGQLFEEIESGRLRLSEAGVKEGDLIALQVKSSLTFVYLLFAIWKQGAQAMLLDSRLKRTETEALLQEYGPHYYICSADRSHPLASFTEEVSFEIVKLQHSKDCEPENVLQLFTSGSTGKPKAIGRTAEAILGDLLKLTAEPLLSRDDRVLALSPLTHTFGLLNGLLLTLYTGACLYFPRSHQSQSILQTLREEKISVMYGVPFHYKLLGQVPGIEPLPELKHAISAGEALSLEVYQAFHDRFGVRIGQQYGTSETGVLTMDWDGKNPESVGRLLPGVSLRIENNEVLAALPESPYLPRIVNERWSGGWFNTADTGSITEEQLLYLAGRTDSIKIIGGLKVNLQEIELKLKHHPKIRDALVCLSEDNEIVEAHVELQESLQESSLLEWCREQMADYKVPRRFFWTSKLPRTSTGKLIRINPHLLRREEERLQKQLYQEPQKVSLLLELGALYEKQGRLLEASDLYRRAKRSTDSSDYRLRIEEDLARIHILMERAAFTKRDYAASLNKVVSIYCYGRSGTHLIKSLLDGHPNIILTMLNGTEIFKLWQSTIKPCEGSMDKEEIVEAIFRTFPDEFNEGCIFEEPKQNGMCALGEGRDQIFTIDRMRFKTEFLEITETADLMDKTFFYQAVQLAASYALGRAYDFTSELPVIIEGGIHFGTSVAETEQLIELFPFAKLFHMIRNPVIAFASALNYQLHAGKASVYNLCFQLQGLFHGIPVAARWTDRTYLVKLEDLHVMPEATLELICKHLGIEWNESLLHSTFGGMKWWNSLSSEVVSGFNTRTISKSYDELLSSFDKFRLESMLRIKYQAWGYSGHDYYNYENLRELMAFPFKFEKQYGEFLENPSIIRTMVHRLCMKLLAEEHELGDTDRLEYQVQLLSERQAENAVR